jgi:hypothetical protein
MTCRSRAEVPSAAVVPTAAGWAIKKLPLAEIFGLRPYSRGALLEAPTTASADSCRSQEAGEGQLEPR